MDNALVWSDTDLDVALEHFLARVQVGRLEDCWPWVGAVATGGYGMAKMLGAQRQTTAHRVAWMLHNGQPIPDGLIVRHRCDHRPCVNPLHLELGTYAQNSRDMVERRRSRNQATGPLPGNATTVHREDAPWWPRVHAAHRRELYGA